MNENGHSGAASPSSGLGGAIRDIVASPLYWLLALLPLAAGLHVLAAGELWVFLCSGVAIIPLAGLMGRATENLAETLGAGIGGLLNATFGNAAELIIALMILWRGPEMYPLVKASITGSIIGNALLVLGLAILLGGIYHSRQRFNRTAAGLGATLLALAAVGLIMPTLFYYMHQPGVGSGGEAATAVEYLSEEIAVVLALIYLLSLWFSLRTHEHLFAGQAADQSGLGKGHQPEWNRSASMTLLALATAGVAWMSELLVGSVEHAAHELGMNQIFTGVIVVAVIGNAAEHSTAVLVAMKNKMDLAVQIAVGSSIQIALFVAPVLVFASLLMGHDRPLDLHFSAMEITALILSVGVLALVCQDGESHWMEGVMLLGVYIIFALAFFHLPE